MLNLIMQLFGVVLKPLIAILQLPDVPFEMLQITNQVLGYIESGLSIVNYFLPLKSLDWAFTLWLAIFSAHLLYLVFLWVYRKIPLLNVN